METIDIGRRIELVSMDRHCANISLGLYCRDAGQGPELIVHTYAAGAAAQDRVAFIRTALERLVGLTATADPLWLRFPCGSLHERPLKRAFREVCKLAADGPLNPKPLQVFDKKAGCELTAENLGEGRYRIVAGEDSAAVEKRKTALAAGLEKLCDMEAVAEAVDQFAFGCRAPHDLLVGLLLSRAQNMRASMREEDVSATRGILAAPSQQK